MIKHNNKNEKELYVHNLPDKTRTSSGIEFDPRQDVWAFRDALNTIHLDFSKVNADPNLILSAKTVFLWYANNLSSAYLTRCFDDFKRFCKTVSGEKDELTLIDVPQILNFKAYLGKEKFWMLASMSLFFRRWYELGLPGVTEGAKKLLDQLKIPGMLKGKAVLTMDPVNGPYSEIEFEAILRALVDAYTLGNITLSDYVMAILFIALGIRPCQCAAIKLLDFEVEKSKDGAKIYILKIPRGKQKEKPVRSEFKDRVLSPKIGALLELHVQKIENDFATLIQNVEETPLFPCKYKTNDHLPGYKYHQTSNSISGNLSELLRSLKVISERTGELMKIYPYRFRRTLGTRAAMEGHGELLIAELLDHTDTQNVGVYVQATPEIVERIDRAMALHLAPLAQAFSGVIIKSESEAVRKEDPTSRICDPRFEPSMKPMGNCGHHGFCGELAPISCYTCRNFQPWLDGPHEAVLNHLISERERLMVVTDARIASINDRTILAVAEVVRRCDEIKGQMGGTRNG